MFDHRITRALAALVVAGALVSCAADAEPRASRGEREGKGKAAHHQRAERKHRDQHAAAKPAHAKPGVARQRPGASAGQTGGVTAPAGSSGTAQSAEESGSGPSCRDDSTGDTDASGGSPSYADVTSGCLRASGSQLRLEAATAGPVPARTPDGNTQLGYGFELTPPSGSTIYVHAQASPEGWATYLSRGHGQRQIGRPTIDGSQVVLTVPLSELGGAQHLEWALESSWLESGLVATRYAFDSAPNIGTVGFDR